MSNADIVCVQHEFGSYGGPAGGPLLALLRELRMPVVTTLHTVLREPSTEQRRVMQELIARSTRLVVMTERGQQMLQEIYQAPAARIDLIAHGIPDMPFIDPKYLQRLSGDRFAQQMRESFTTRLMELFGRTAQPDWPWFEDVLNFTTRPRAAVATPCTWIGSTRTRAPNPPSPCCCRWRKCNSSETPPSRSIRRLSPQPSHEHRCHPAPQRHAASRSNPRAAPIVSAPE